MRISTQPGEISGESRCPRTPRRTRGGLSTKHTIALVIVAASLAAGWKLSAVEPTSTSIEPAFADRLFGYVKLAPVFEQTPAKSRSAVVPACVVIYGENESAALVAAAGRIAFELGNWVEETATAGGGLPIVMSDAEFVAAQESESPGRAAPTTPPNVIVVGSNNRLSGELGSAVTGPTIRLIEQDSPRRQLLYVGGASDDDIVRAATLVAERVAFKAGAYRTFYSFVELLALIEHSEWNGAAALVRSPGGLAACGRNIQMAAPMMAHFPDEAKEVVRLRNDLLYSKLPAAIEANNQDEARTIWFAAQRTCYACHQGQDGVPVMRKFTPPEQPHILHNEIALGYGLLDQRACGECHDGKSTLRGYQPFGE